MRSSVPVLVDWGRSSALLCALVLASPAIARAYCLTTTVDPMTGELCSSEGLALSWKRQCIAVSVMDPGPDVASLSDAQDVVDLAFGAWLDVRCNGAPLALEVKQTSEPAQCMMPQYNTHGANANSVAFISDWKKYEAMSSDAFGQTFVFYNPDMGVIYDADILINEMLAPLTICSETCPSGVVDMQNVLTHEAGHFLGLGHSDHPDATMFADAPIAQTSKRTLTDDDRAGVCAIYGDDAQPKCKDSDFTPNHGFSPKCDAPAADSSAGSNSSSGCGVQATTGSRGYVPVAVLLAALALVRVRARRRGRFRTTPGGTLVLVVALAITECGFVLVNRVRADGALPNSFGVLLPKDHPHSILVATNFGLVTSDDDGAHWSLVCEEAVGIGAALYQIGPPPEDRLFTVTLDGFATSTDLGCGWHEILVLNKPSDVFPDPSDADVVYAIAKVAAGDGGASPQAVFVSKDGGRTFGAAQFTAPMNAYLTGVEAAGDKSTLYATLTLFEAEASHPYVARSGDRGKTWSMSSIEATAGTQLPRILAVDPRDSTRVYLRLSGTATDQLGIYDSDTGEVAIAFDLQGAMSAFLRRADGTLLVASDDGNAFVSKSDGMSFKRLAGAPHLRGLGERGAKLYASTDASQNDFAVAVSDDDGASWRRLLRFADIGGLRQCGTIASTCAMAWDALGLQFAMPSGPVPLYDAGTREARPAGGQLSRSSGGGGCSVTWQKATSMRAGWLATIALVCDLLFVRRRARDTTVGRAFSFRGLPLRSESLFHQVDERFLRPLAGQSVMERRV